MQMGKAASDTGWAEIGRGRGAGGAARHGLGDAGGGDDGRDHGGDDALASTLMTPRLFDEHLFGFARDV